MVQDSFQYVLMYLNYIVIEGSFSMPPFSSHIKQQYKKQLFGYVPTISPIK